MAWAMFGTKEKARKFQQKMSKTHIVPKKIVTTYNVMVGAKRTRTVRRTRRAKRR